VDRGQRGGGLVAVDAQPIVRRGRPGDGEAQLERDRAQIEARADVGAPGRPEIEELAARPRLGEEAEGSIAVTSATRTSNDA
jgi:hypothetical protein